MRNLENVMSPNVKAYSTIDGARRKLRAVFGPSSTDYAGVTTAIIVTRDDKYVPTAILKPEAMWCAGGLAARGIYVTN